MVFKLLSGHNFCDAQSSKGNNSKSIKGRVTFVHSARHLMLIDICIKFREYSLSDFQVIERTRFVTDRQTDGQTDARGKTICLPTLKGGDIIARKG